MTKGSSTGPTLGDEFDGRDLLRTLIDTLPDQFYLKDTEGRYVFNNTGHAKVLGIVSPEEAAGKTVFDFYPKELAERYYADEQEIFRSGQPLVGKEEPSVDEEGHRRWHSTTKVPLRDASKKIVGLVGMTRDITERKEAEEALSKSRARFQAVFENAAIGMALVDMEGRLTESNLALREMLGYSNKELCDMTWVEVTYPDDVELDMSHFERLKAGELDSYQFEKRYVRKDGRVIWGHLTGSLIHSDEGEPQFMVGMVEDVTERKEAEEKLRKSEASLAEAQSIAHLGNWEWDIKTGEFLWSDEVFRIYGYEAKEFVPTFEKLMELAYPEDRELVKKNIDGALYEGNP
jgi:PAS domain S-box-containing protein